MIANPNSLPIVLEGDIEPRSACGGVWIDSLGGFAPAVIAKFEDTGTGHTIWEYAEVDPATGEPVKGADDEFVVRATLIHVPAGRISPVWFIKPDTAPLEYYESHETVAGKGLFFCWESATADAAAEARSIPLPQTPQTPLDILPGDFFQVQAAPTVGVYVLSTCASAPFKDEYEERVIPRPALPQSS